MRKALIAACISSALAVSIFSCCVLVPARNSATRQRQNRLRRLQGRVNSTLSTNIEFPKDSIYFGTLELQLKIVLVMRIVSVKHVGMRSSICTTNVVDDWLDLEIMNGTKRPILFLFLGNMASRAERSKVGAIPDATPSEESVTTVD